LTRSAHNVPNDTLVIAETKRDLVLVLYLDTHTCVQLTDYVLIGTSTGPDHRPALVTNRSMIRKY